HALPAATSSAAAPSPASCSAVATRLCDALPLAASTVARSGCRRSILAAIDGGTGLRSAITQVFGAHALVQRCQVHKKRNGQGRHAQARTALRRLDLAHIALSLPKGVA